jgi:hypothetical protein
MNIAHLIFVKLPAPGDMMPGTQASAAAGRAGVLGHKHRVPAKRGLATVVHNNSRCQPVANKIKRMGTDSCKTFAGNESPIVLRQAKTRPKPGRAQPFKKLGHTIMRFRAVHRLL